jgi:glycerol-3-phosphate acyltransferase
MAMATPTGNPIFNRMLNLRNVVKGNLVAGLLRFRQSTVPATKVAAPAVPPACLLGNGSKTMVLEVDALLLKSSPPSAAALFPPFFLVAVEAGSFARGLLLLALYPFLRLMTKV